MQDISIIGIIVTVVVLVILLFMAIGYVKAPPDMAYIISGVKKKVKGSYRKGEHTYSVF